MDDLKGKLIETAIRPLEDNAEMKLAAGQLLGDLVEANGVGAEEAIARWNAVDGKTRRLKWQMVLFWLLVCLLAVIWVPTALDIFGFIRLIKASDADDKPDYRIAAEKRFGTRLSNHQKLLLFGDSSKATQVEKMKALWDSQSANPVYFSEYVRVYLKETKQLPPDFLLFARLIDPENAWFTYLAAAVEADGSYDPVFAKKTRKDAALPPWKIRDQAKLEESAALFHEAPHYTTKFKIS